MVSNTLSGKSNIQTHKDQKMKRLSLHSVGCLFSLFIVCLFLCLSSLCSVVSLSLPGKTIADAKGDVFRGLEVVEYSSSVASQLMGETVEGVSKNVDTYSYRQPIGVAAGICPFNFPAMIPMWMFPMALACGNTYILKPSEKTPGASMVLADLSKQAGVPDGVLNIIHGGHEAVNFLCDASPVRALSFVGGNKAGLHIHSRGSANGKRVQSNMGAKNHATILPDADKETTLNQLTAAGFGAAGQRCMALSVALFVGESQKWIPELKARAQGLRVGAGTDAKADLGPLISKERVSIVCVR